MRKKARAVTRNGYVSKICVRRWDPLRGLTWSCHWETMIRLYSEQEARTVCGEPSVSGELAYTVEPTAEVIEQARRDAPPDRSEFAARIRERETVDAPPIFNSNAPAYQAGMTVYLKGKR